ncbi:TorD/DmsD family molecular chaperone [Bradyrhizobium sp. McL0616]|uniref:TorD/DmsD family molecular chaperone n=1 Tax=Bradyrhizobium sp. McL0616 TaxID=3415674 RepID=UPI003CEBA8D1
MQQPAPHVSAETGSDGIDRARSREYALLATLLARSPDTEMIKRLALLQGDDSSLGTAHAALADAAANTSEECARREYFNLFVGLGQGLLSPYASHYLTGSLYARPLARLRETLQRLGIESVRRSEPEDHISILCEIMAGLVGGDIPAPTGTDREFFEKHLTVWARRLFVDLERAESAPFYSSVGALGRIFMDIEIEAYSLPA